MRRAPPSGNARAKGERRLDVGVLPVRLDAKSGAAGPRLAQLAGRAGWRRHRRRRTELNHRRPIAAARLSQGVGDPGGGRARRVVGHAPRAVDDEDGAGRHVVGRQQRFGQADREQRDHGHAEHERGPPQPPPAHPEPEAEQREDGQRQQQPERVGSGEGEGERSGVGHGHCPRVTGLRPEAISRRPKVDG
jgi:hypothetical protein